VPVRTDYYNELGLRILLGFVARGAVRYDRGVRVLFSHCTRHYFRAYVELYHGRGEVKRTQDSLGFVQHCFGCLRRAYRKLNELEKSCDCMAPLSTAGPLWGAEFADREFCGKLVGELNALAFANSAKEAKLVETVALEQDVLTPYYDFHKLCGVLSRDAPKREVFFERLKSAGFKVSQTHFSPLGVRTDAPYSEIVLALSGI
jgi:tRNA (guanine26-N2/guanine27-N2)-dimethyltransferase